MTSYAVTRGSPEDYQVFQVGSGRWHTSAAEGFAQSDERSPGLPVQ